MVEPPPVETEVLPAGRRLKATIIGDLVGYSRLIEKDDQGTVDFLSELKRERVQPALDQYSSWTRWSGGDRLLALFDSVVDAVECACAIQRALDSASKDEPPDRQIRMRIGINFGDVIFEDSDVAGDSVNVAARLEELCEPGGLAISEAAYREVQHRVDLNFEDLGRRRLKNLNKPVRVYGVEAADVLQLARSPVSRLQRLTKGLKRYHALTRPWVMLTIAIAAVGLVLLLNHYATDPDGPEAIPIEPNSIAVLPFENMRDDPTQDFIARGLATDLISDLSQFEEASVVARNSSFRYQQRPIDLKEVSHLLRAKYVIDGTVWRIGDQIRVTISLVDTEADRQLWATRFEGDTEEILDFHDGVAIALLSALGIEAATSDRAPSRENVSFSTIQDFYTAREAYYDNDMQALVTARALLQEIIDANPNFTEAYAYLAAVYWAAFDDDRGTTLGLDPADSVDLAWDALTKSLEFPLPLTFQVKARMLAWENDYVGAQEAAEKAVQMDPNDPVGDVTMAIVLIYRGQMEEALTYLARANTSDPLNLGEYLFWEGMAKYLLMDYDEAVRILQRSIELNADDEWTYLVLGAALAQQGLQQEAEEQIALLQSLRRAAGNPDYNLRHVRYWSFEREEETRHLCDGLAKAGLAGRCE